MRSARIALCVRGNHEQRLLASLEAAENPAKRGTLAHTPLWFVRDVPRALWSRWRAMLEAMQFAATVPTAHGPVGLVHASPTAPSWRTTLDALRAGCAETMYVALWSIARARGDARQAVFEDVPSVDSIAGVRAVLTAHCIMEEFRVTGNVWHLDTGAGTANGRLTLARIDTNPIESVTLSTGRTSQPG